jgi:uncharacterized protein YebE (UPF0316 family)
MFDFTATNIFVSALLIFLLRVADMSLDTMRILAVYRGKKLPAWVLGFLQSFIFIVAITSVLANLTNIWSIIGYAAGFATGNLVGMVINDRFTRSFRDVRVITSAHAPEILGFIRGSGHAATEMPGFGMEGKVSVIHTSVGRDAVGTIRDGICLIDRNAFITVEELTPVNRGFWRS